MLVAIMACVRLVGRCSLSYLLLYYQLSCATNVIIRLDMHILLENALLLSYVVSRLTFTNGPKRNLAFQQCTQTCVAGSGRQLRTASLLNWITSELNGTLLKTAI